MSQGKGIGKTSLKIRNTRTKQVLFMHLIEEKKKIPWS